MKKFMIVDKKHDVEKPYLFSGNEKKIEHREAIFRDKKEAESICEKMNFSIHVSQFEVKAFEV